nr:ALPV-022 [Albatrosspox virus]
MKCSHINAIIKITFSNYHPSLTILFLLYKIG